MALYGKTKGSVQCDVTTTMLQYSDDGFLMLMRSGGFSQKHYAVWQYQKGSFYSDQT